MKSILIFVVGALAGAAGLFYALQNDFATPSVAVITQSAPSQTVQYAPTPVAPSERPLATQSEPSTEYPLSYEPSEVEASPALPAIEEIQVQTAPVESLQAHPLTDEPSEIEASQPFPAIEQIPVQTVPVESLPVHPGALLIPVTGIVMAQLSDTFTDKRGTDRIHEALDIMAPLKTPVVAVDDGIVVKLFDSVPGGLTVYQYDASGTFAYYYAHLDSYAADLVEGQALKRGDLIGYVGVTGNSDPLAPHLHFAVFLLGAEKQWWKGTAINPYPLLSR